MAQLNGLLQEHCRMNEELTCLIIKELRKHRGRKVIIQKVSERGGLNWKQAEQLVLLIEAQQKRTIAVQQTPPLLFLSIAALLLGIGLLAVNIPILLGAFQNDALGHLLSPQNGSYGIFELITGLGMTVGGMIGLWKAFGAIFSD
jgi:hypothetical protein